MKMNIYPCSMEASRALIRYLVQKLSDAPEKVFNIAFSGGSTPLKMFDLWANEYADITPWERIRFWWVDERCVEPRSPESNYGQMKRVLLDQVGIPEEHIFRIYGEDDPKKEAKRYSDLVKKFLPIRNKCPLFDLVLLGIGEDGHTSSIFIGQEELLSSPEIYAVSTHPVTKQKRVALTGASIINAEQTIFFVTGAEKQKVVCELYLSGDINPAAYIAHRANNVEFFLDEAAAGEKDNSLFK
ncbi:6-phosphogluconolactonase [Bacteroides sp. 224]|uniref:6-phosphogluconolactonase n=1 Tax=Bacteroides sp. 224 TaxID=2302936 RepID=UPI0013D64DF3|nr:6-phosphogluconolactonase [Bacteroides sp. 224]NDV66735.1 6-phosphogluconolactonase [Bacteroides sp. 224]